MMRRAGGEEGRCVDRWWSVNGREEERGVNSTYTTPEELSQCVMKEGWIARREKDTPL